MTDSPARRRASAEKASDRPIGPADMAEIGNRNYEAAQRAAAAYWDGAAKIYQEWADFFSDRIRKDVESAQALMASSSREEAFHAQADFFETAIRDYADGASRFMNLTADVAKDAMSPVGKRAEELLQVIDNETEAAKDAEPAKPDAQTARNQTTRAA
ncbi:MAG: phasin family protein [Pseudomonadota bacterium]